MIDEKDIPLPTLEEYLQEINKSVDEGGLGNLVDETNPPAWATVSYSMLRHNLICHWRILEKYGLPDKIHWK